MSPEEERRRWMQRAAKLARKYPDPNQLAVALHVDVATARDVLDAIKRDDL